MFKAYYYQRVTDKISCEFKNKIMLEKIDKIQALLNVPNVDADPKTAIANMKILNILVDLRAEAKQLNLSGVMPCFEFSNKATKYTENGVTTLAVDTDGIALTNDNLPDQAYTLEEGVKYTVKLYKG